ncbi:ParA family protein [Paenarthrobacter sp. NPDC090517]|uniref:ParA family protein n=1 Tax=Paenarthrobacter sp. NPDC090517 TaxID=3364381 RepID=UPI00381DAEEB
MATDKESIREFPPISARINGDNTGVLIIGTNEQLVGGESTNDVRRALITMVVKEAELAGQTLRVTTSDDEGIEVLLVHPDGTLKLDDKRPTEAIEADEPEVQVEPETVRQEAPAATVAVKEHAPAVTRDRASRPAPVIVQEPFSVEPDGTVESPAAASSRWNPEFVNASAVTTVSEREKDDSLFYVLGHGYDLDNFVQDGPAEQGFNGWLNKLTGGSSKLAPGVSEAAARREQAELLCCERIIRQATWQRGSVAFTVANKKGNSAKTPATVSVSGILASIRGGSVAMMEVSDDPGQLAGRSEGEQRSGIGELVLNAANVTTKAQLEGYAIPQTSFAHTFGSSPTRRAPLDRQSIETVSALIDQFYTIRAMDSGNVYTSSAFAGALATSDALLVPMMNASDSMGEAVELFHFLESHDDPHFRELANRAIVVRVSDGRPEYKVERLVKDFMHQTGVAEDRMFTVPYDAHLAERGAITLDKLAPATRAAFVRIAAALVVQLQDAVANPTPQITSGRRGQTTQAH